MASKFAWHPCRLAGGLVESMGRWPVLATGSVAVSKLNPPGEPPDATAEPAVLPYARVSVLTPKP